MIYISTFRFIVLAALSGVLAISCSSTQGGQSASAKTKTAKIKSYEVDFMQTDRLTEALERADEEGKLVFIDFYTTWCLPCKVMDEEVFTDRAFGQYMNERFVSLKIDAESGNGPNLAALYEVRAFPTLLFVDGKGRVQARKEGAAHQRELRSLGSQALATVN